MAKQNQKSEFEIISEKLDKIIDLLQQSIAINLYLNDSSQEDICKNLQMGKQTVNKIVQGVKKKKNILNNE